MLKVSIIIPVYKVVQYVERCINSVISQTYKGEIECIIVDDCSPLPDRSWDVVEAVVNSYKGGNISSFGCDIQRKYIFDEMKSRYIWGGVKEHYKLLIPLFRDLSTKCTKKERLTIRTMLVMPIFLLRKKFIYHKIDHFFCYDE